MDAKVYKFPEKKATPPTPLELQANDDWLALDYTQWRDPLEGDHAIANHVREEFVKEALKLFDAFGLSGKIGPVEVFVAAWDIQAQAAAKILASRR